MMFIIPAPNPIAFKIFDLSVYKYGVIMAFSILVAMVVANYLYNRLVETNETLKNAKKDIIFEYAPLIIIAGILGARLYFCILNPVYYFSHPIEILDIRQGGLSIHGAILGGLFSVIYMAKKTKVSFLSIMDTLAGGIFIGQSIGRWGNYFNSEAFGIPVYGQNWGLFIPKDLRPAQFTDFSLFHPTFLYESILDFVGFFIMLFIFYRFKNIKGIAFFSYLVIYSIIRFFIESIRIDSALNIGVVPVAQVVSVIMFLVGVTGLVWIVFKRKSVKFY